MNIIMVCDYLPEDIEGGSDRILREHSSRLRARGHLVEIIAGQSGARSNNAARLFRTLVRCRRAFEKTLARLKPDVINFHQPLSAFSVLSSRRSRDIYKVYTFNSPWHREYEVSKYKRPAFYRINSFLRRVIERFSLDRCDRIITISEYMKEEAVKIHNIKREKVSVIPGGVDINKFKPPYSKAEARKRLSIPEDKFVILSVRNFTKRTGLIEFLKASRRMLEKKRTILVMVGGGPLKEEAEDLIKEYRLESSVIMTGFVPDTLLPSYYQASDLFVMPTQDLEGFGLALIEALSSGLPILATPVGGIKEVLSAMDKDVFFEDTSLDSLSKGLERFMNDTAALKHIAGRARSYAVERYSWDNIIPRLEKALQKVSPSPILSPQSGERERVRG